MAPFTPCVRGAQIDFSKTGAECRGSGLDREAFAQLLETGYLRGKRPVRLLGLGGRLDESSPDLQLGLF